jgi:hypothetical protein
MVEMSSHIPQNLILGNSNHSFRCQMDGTERIAISDLETQGSGTVVQLDDEFVLAEK